MMQGFMSNLTYSGRRSTLMLFINGRSVECGQLKRAIESTYLVHNPKAAKPWLFMVSTPAKEWGMGWEGMLPSTRALNQTRLPEPWLPKPTIAVHTVHSQCLLVISMLVHMGWFSECARRGVWHAWAGTVPCGCAA